MPKKIKRLLPALLVGSFVAVGSGCSASAGTDVAKMAEDAMNLARQAQEAAANALNTAGSAQSTANQALQAANDAQSCCAANTDRIERMFQKAMTK